MIPANYHTHTLFCDGKNTPEEMVLEAIRLTLKLPGCSKQFPRDVGKDRPCLNYHMNQCAGWCQAGRSSVEYRALMEQARQLYHIDDKEINKRAGKKLFRALEGKCVTTKRD